MPSTTRTPVALLASLALALLSSCSGFGRTIDRLPSDASARGYIQLPRPVSLPRSRVTAECVPESLCAVMNYWGRPASVQELSFLARQPGVGPLFPTQVPAVARQKGFRAEFVEGSVGRIRNAIDRGVPPIIGVSSGGGNFHAFVVSAYSDREQQVVCEEYGDTKRLFSYEEIEELWQPAGHLMLEMEISRAEELIRDGAEREARGKYPEAAALYRKALELDPDQSAARAGLGNCLLFQGKLEEALAEFQKAHEQDSADARVSNNLAHVLVELGRDLPRAETLAEGAADRFLAAYRAAKSAMERELQPAIRGARQKEVRDAELDLAGALATLGQARAANGKHDLAVAAWKASRDHLPLTEFDARARRLYEIALSTRRLGMPAAARDHLEAALAEAREPELRAKIEAALKSGGK